jgi:hypothetical protein
LWVPPSHFSRTMVPPEPSPPVSGLSVSLSQWISKKTSKNQERARKGRWFQWNHHPRLRLIFGKCSGS